MLTRGELQEVPHRPPSKSLSIAIAACGLAQLLWVPVAWNTTPLPVWARVLMIFASTGLFVYGVLCFRHARTRDAQS